MCVFGSPQKPQSCNLQYAPILKAVCTHSRTHASIFAHISVHILPFWLTRKGQEGCVGPSLWPTTKNMSPWSMVGRGLWGELGGKDLAALWCSLALNLASHSPSMLLPGFTSTNRKHTVHSPPPTSHDVIININMHLHCCTCRRVRKEHFDR